MGVRPARKPNKLGKMPIRIAIGTAAFCAGLALLHKLWLPLSFKQGALHASGTVVVTNSDGLPSPSSSLQTDSPGTLSSSSFSDVVQEEMVDSRGDRSGDVAVKALSFDPLFGQKGQDHVKDEEEHEKDEKDKEKDKDGSQEEDKDEQQRYEEEENKGLTNGGWKEGKEGDDDDDDDYDDDFLSGKWEEDEEEDDDTERPWSVYRGKDEEEEVINTVKKDFAAASNFVTEAIITEEEKEEVIPSLAECQTNYGERRFLPEDEKALPPILYSFPGK